LKIFLRYIYFCFYLIIYSCTSSNHLSFDPNTSQCQMDTRFSTNCSINKGQICIELPYYNDKSSSIELLTFILHGNHNAALKNINTAKMHILFKPSYLSSQHKIKVHFLDNLQQISICSKNNRDWFNSKKNFLLSLQQKYLNVANHG